MTRNLILVWADSETGEVMNLDGTSSSVIVPKEPHSYVQTGLVDKVDDVVVTHKQATKYATQPLYAKGKVDLSGAAVKLPEKVSRIVESPVQQICDIAWNDCIDQIIATRPKGE